MRFGLAAALLALTAGITWAADAVPVVQAGEWEVLEALPGEMPIVHRECVKADHLERLVNQSPDLPAGCIDHGLRRSGNTFTREMRCRTATGPVELRRSVWEHKSAIYLVNHSERVVGDKTLPVATVEMVRAGNCPAAGKNKK